MPAPEPKTELGRYRVLSPTAGVRVSPLQLGAMSIGDAWTTFMGSMDKAQSFSKSFRVFLQICCCCCGEGFGCQSKTMGKSHNKRKR
jgi:hypothetical protein